VSTSLPGIGSRYSLAAEAWQWQLYGNCRGLDSEIFFHPDGERGRARAARAHQAKRICRECPVQAECREYALAVGEPYGVWGGMTEEERRACERTGGIFTSRECAFHWRA
jgi:WhiB family redox-sensing transcriptional regulator